MLIQAWRRVNSILKADGVSAEEGLLGSVMSCT